MKLSSRSDWRTTPSTFATAVETASRRGTLLDLRGSNPTAVDLLHPPEVYAQLGDPVAARYNPAAQGLATAREAITHYYERRGRTVAPERVWLHASTSEAYWQWLTIMGDPGDTVLVPQPGYPLFETLGELASVHCRPYPLHYDGQWHIDFAGLDTALSQHDNVRAIAVVAPGNPTGHIPTPEEWQGLRERAAAHDIALIVDEVFADYLHGEASHAAVWTEAPLDDEVVCVVLSGLSKVAALPQMKLSWSVVYGPEPARTELGHRMEHLADALLSVASPVQLALPALLQAAETIQPTVRQRLDTNLQVLRHTTEGYPVDMLSPAGGWTVLVRLPQLPDWDDLRWSLLFLEEGVWVHPGFVFDLAGPPKVALSLLTPPTTFAVGLGHMLKGVHAVVDGVHR